MAISSQYGTPRPCSFTIPNVRLEPRTFGLTRKRWFKLDRFVNSIKTQQSPEAYTDNYYVLTSFKKEFSEL